MSVILLLALDVSSLFFFAMFTQIPFSYLISLSPLFYYLFSMVFSEFSNPTLLL